MEVGKTGIHRYFVEPVITFWWRRSTGRWNPWQRLAGLFPPPDREPTTNAVAEWSSAKDSIDKLALRILLPAIQNDQKQIMKYLAERVKEKERKTRWSSFMFNVHFSECINAHPFSSADSEVALSTAESLIRFLFLESIPMPPTTTTYTLVLILYTSARNLWGLKKKKSFWMYKLPYSLQRCDTDADIICTFKDIVHCSAFVF